MRMVSSFVVFLKLGQSITPANICVFSTYFDCVEDEVSSYEQKYQSL